MIILVALLAAALLLWICSIDWRISVKVALYVVVLEGALRKWVFPQASEFIYFLKDGVLLGAYIGYLRHQRAPFRALKTRGGMLILSVAMVAILFFEVLNPSLNSILVGLLGAKGYLLYVPLAFLLPDLFRSPSELHVFLRRYVLFCIPVGLLGIAQFFAPPESAINVYAPSLVETEAITFEDGNVRITGTFPFLGGLMAYLTLNFALVFALFVHQRLWRWRIMLGSVLLLIVADSFMTGSRWVVLSALILMVGFCVYSLFEKTPRNRRLAVLLLVACGLCALVSFKAFPTAVESFLSRANSEADSVSERIGNGFLEPLAGMQYSGIGGFGAGSTQIACFALRDQLHLAPPTHYAPAAEGEMLRVMLELGAFGFVAWYALRLYILWLLLRETRTLRHPMLRHLALAAFLFHALLFNGQLVTNTTVGVLYWFLAGFAFLLPELDRFTPGTRQPSRRFLRRANSVAGKLPVSDPVPVASA